METLCRHPARQGQYLAQVPRKGRFEICVANTYSRLDESKLRLSSSLRGVPTLYLGDCASPAPGLPGSSRT